MTPWPWQQAQWGRLSKAIAAGRLPHGLLLHGPAGIGLERFAFSLAARLLCDKPTEDHACGQCKACVLFASGNHPDVAHIVPETPGKQIKVEAIRELIDFIHLKSQYGKSKIAIIEPADAMNRSAANTLLKTLEEPPASSLLILNSQEPHRLPVTVRSRCQQVEFDLTGDKTAISWLENQLQDNRDAGQLLQLAGGPLAALELLEDDQLEQRRQILDDLIALGRGDSDPLTTAKHWNELGAVPVIYWLQRLFMDLLRLKVTETPPFLRNTDIIGRLRPLLNGVDLRQILSCCQLLARINGQQSSTVTYNSQAMLEEFVFFWRNVATSGGVSQ